MKRWEAASEKATRRDRNRKTRVTSTFSSLLENLKFPILKFPILSKTLQKNFLLGEKIQITSLFELKDRCIALLQRNASHDIIKANDTAVFPR